MSRSKIGIVTTWFERGAAYVSRQIRDVLREEFDVEIYARGGAYAQGDPNWDGPNIWWGKKSEFYSDGVTILKDDYLSWLRNKSIDLVLFNEQQWLPPVLWTTAEGIKAAAYVDYYTEDTVGRFEAYDALICNTRRHHSVFDWHPGAVHIPWGTDLEVFKPSAPGNRLVDEGIVTFFHSAGMNPYRKGCDLLLQAFAGVQGSSKLVVHTQKALTDALPGQTELVNYLVREGRLEIITGDVTAPGLYHLGDVYVYPSRLEGIGLTLAEAAACGLGVITTDNPPMSEFIVQGMGAKVSVETYRARADGYYWPMSDVSVPELMGSLQACVDRPENVVAWKYAARRHAECNLDWRQNARGLAGFLKDVIKRPSTGSRNVNRLLTSDDKRKEFILRHDKLAVSCVKFAGVLAKIGGYGRV